ncbi:YetF domain-containing protein [Microvirga splendida]|uniref:YetF C-terminal domain-containing protein n=1 Tax=Microvirga splendida TaxID=2795727 RepID=A0ABS0Y155_9HYPH|nr:YetF domain-containing protein [Microvirga splendida]MBJ6126023.1 hypothetical protein [Microvirga splendida]
MAEVLAGSSPWAVAVEVGVLVLLALALAWRIASCRRISRMSVFDIGMAVTLAVSVLALAHGKDITPHLAFALVLLGFQIAASPGRHTRPVLLVHDGAVLAEALGQENITVQDIDTAVRDAGYASIDRVRAVVLTEDRALAVIGSTADTEQNQPVDP